MKRSRNGKKTPIFQTRQVEVNAKGEKKKETKLKAEHSPNHKTMN